MKNTINNMPVNPGSGGGSRGGWLGHIFGMLRGVKMEQLSRDRYAWQQGFLTDEMKKRDINRASAQAAGKVVGEDMRQKNTAKNAFAFEKKRTSKNKKTGAYNFPDLIDIGPAEDPTEARWSSRSGQLEQIAAAKREAEARKAEVATPGKPFFNPAGGANQINLADEPQMDFNPTGGFNAPGAPQPGTPNLNTSSPSSKTPRARKPRAPKPPKAGA